MPTAITAVQTISEAGTTPIAGQTGDTTGMTYQNSGKQWIEAVNGAAAAATVTVAFPYLIKGQQLPAKSYPLAASVGAAVRIGPLDPAIYGATVTFTPSATTVMCAVWQTG